MQKSTPPLLSDTDESAIPERHQAAQRSTWISVAVNIFLTLLQLMVGVFAHSQALIADAFHSLSDMLSDFVVLIANKYSKKAADANHPYGHYRFENAASFIVGILLLAVGIGMLWSAGHKLANPGLLVQVHSMALWVALSALVVKEGLFRYMLHVAEKVRSSMLIANAWHARSDAASSLIVALGIMGNLLGFTLLDSVAALIIGLFVSKMGWKFTWSALGDLMDRAISTEYTEQIYQTILATPGIYGAHELRTRKLGDLIAIDVHLEVDGTLSIQAGHDLTIAVKQRITKALPSVISIMAHLDPISLHNEKSH
jgi:cation diffusion facilitator family transporter